MGTLYSDMSNSDLKDELVGHSIVSMDPAYGTITLDNGKTLVFEGTGLDDSWFIFELIPRIYTSRTITDVVEEDAEPRNESVAWVHHILAGDEVVADLYIEGKYTSEHDDRQLSIDLTVSQLPRTPKD